MMKLCVREEGKQCNALVLSGFGNDFTLNNFFSYYSYKVVLLI